MTKLKTLMDLTGRRALITGGAGRLGRVMADTLGELGAELILVDLLESPVAALARELELRHGIKATVEICDLEDADQRINLAARITDLGGLSVLINNAAFVGTTGLTGWAEPLERQTIETWRRAIEVNLTSVFHLSQLFSLALRQAPGGTIINISSIYGLWGPDWSLYDGTNMANPAAYSASKGGLIQLTRWLATTLAPDIRVNTLSPGGVERGQDRVFVTRYIARTPLKRMAREDDFRGAIAYLASDMSAYVTGQVLAVDGGWGVW